MSNPYIARSPLQDSRMFYGRAHELGEIAAFLQSNQSVSIVGPRKIGKTSLLFHLMRPDTCGALGIGRENLFVYLDCAVLANSSQLEIFVRFCTEMSAAFRSQRRDSEPILQAAMTNPSRLAFEGVVRRLNQRGLRVVLMLDEFERLSSNSHLDVNFFNALRSAAGRFQLVLLTASTLPLIALTYANRAEEIISSPFFNIFAPLFLVLLPEKDARALIRMPMQNADIPVNIELENFIYELVGGHPFALQVACFHACEMPDDFAAIKRQTLQELEAHLQSSWNKLSPIERDVLRHLSQAVKRERQDPETRTVLRDLIQKCLLIQARGSYDYPSKAWTEFVGAIQSIR